MKAKSAFLILIGLMISSLSFGQKVLNTNYKIEKRGFKLALIPISNERNSFNGTIMAKVFNDNQRSMTLFIPNSYSNKKNCIFANQLKT